MTDNGLLKTIEHWFFMINPKPIQLIMNVIRQPFKDLRYAALSIFLQLASQQWAQRLMSEQGGNLF